MKKVDDNEFYKDLLLDGSTSMIDVIIMKRLSKLLNNYIPINVYDKLNENNINNKHFDLFFRFYFSKSGYFIMQLHIAVKSYVDRVEIIIIDNAIHDCITLSIENNPATIFEYLLKDIDYSSINS